MPQQNPLANPVLRYAVGASGAIAVAAIAYLFLDGTVQLVAYAIAVLDVLVTPQILKRAAAG
ncbi:hypothetical protein [Haloplanus halophilus]|uniref:hypothetical protein n=1 Tax=Haloplanus halophilus TaxID=2949993 RepID=UPI002040493F|nr:hypothetical protein [Haloplanus sp. GDY1]